MADKIDALKRLTAYHEDVQAFQDHFNETAVLVDSPDLTVLRMKLRAFHEKVVVAHFKFEEEVVFPSVRQLDQDPEIRNFMDALQKEHVAMTEMSERLLQTTGEVLDGEISETSRNSTREQLEHLRKRLTAHARSEDAMLVERIRKNSSIQLLMGRAYLAVQARKRAQGEPISTFPF